MSTILGQLLCPTHSVKDEIPIVNGPLIEGAEDFEVLSLPVGPLQDVTKLKGNIATLRCGCTVTTFFKRSEQEWLKTPEQAREEHSA